MNHYTLRFPDELGAEATADKMGYLDENGELRNLGHEGAIDVIGQVAIPGTYDDEGNEIKPPTIVSGFFVNLSISPPLPANLVPFVVPYGRGGRVFAGTIPDDNAWPPK